ncbi:MAG: Flagellar export protein FliJ [Verrucomicrobiales bacterium]|nr:Flagellar export protein FliJ [Verrucomicrobiales bacterium]
MKPFKCSLQALLTLREREEHVALQEYGKALRQLEESRHKLELVQHELDSANARLHQRFLSSGPAGQLAQLQDFCAAVEKKRRECEYILKVAQNKSQQAFTKLVAARQAKAVVTKYFENQKKRHQQECRKEEQKALDDLVNSSGSALWSLKKQNLWN